MLLLCGAVLAASARAYLPRERKPCAARVLITEAGGSPGAEPATWWDTKQVRTDERQSAGQVYKEIARSVIIHTTIV